MNNDIRSICSGLNTLQLTNRLLGKEILVNCDAQIEHYCAAVEQCLKSLPHADRADVRAQIKSKIEEARFFTGLPTQDILASLGEPQAVARVHLQEFLARHEASILRKTCTRISLRYQTGALKKGVPSLVTLLAVILMFVGITIPINGFVNAGSALLFSDTAPLVAQAGTPSFHPTLLFPLSLVAGALFIIGGLALIHGTRKHVKTSTPVIGNEA